MKKQQKRKMEFKRIKKTVRYCSKCEMELLGNGSITLPYWCNCGQWHYDDEEKCYILETNQKEMKEDIKSLKERQDKEFRKKFDNLHLVRSWSYEECACDDGKLDCEDIVLEFIDRVRKETAEAVCDKMIGKEEKIEGVGCVSDADMGYNRRIKEEKEIKLQIVSEFRRYKKDYTRNRLT